jgi:very-short-patch-repair endonuclease
MKQLYGYKFRRQHPVDHFIVDFVCLEKRLIIELDGGHHAEHKTQQYDIQRLEYLHAQGFKVLRFWNNEVFENMDGVLELIMEGLLDPPPAAPPARGGD